MFERVLHVKLWMQVSNHWVEDILESLVSFLVSCIESNRIFLVVHSTLDAKLNFAAKMGCPLFHLGPNFLGKMLFEKRVAVIFKDGVVHEGNLLRVGTVYRNSVLLKFFLRYEI